MTQQQQKYKKWQNEKLYSSLTLAIITNNSFKLLSYMYALIYCYFIPSHVTF